MILPTLELQSFQHSALLAPRKQEPYAADPAQYAANPARSRDLANVYSHKLEGGTRDSDKAGA